MINCFIKKKTKYLFIFSFLFAIEAKAATDWTGAISSEWHLNGNWNPPSFPTAATDVTISLVALQNGCVIDLPGENAAALLVDSAVPIGTTQALLIHNGGTLNSNFKVALIGNSAATQGNVTVDGIGSSWTNIGFLIVGNSGTGTGTLNISNGGLVESSGCNVGNNPGINGIVNLSSGGSWINSSTLLLGNSTSGTLNVSGSLVSSGTIILGNITGSGTLNISGGSVITPVITDVIIVGNDTGGTGTFTISGGSAETALVAIANNAGFSGSLVVDNQGVLSTGGLGGGPGTKSVLFGDSPNGQGILRALNDNPTFIIGFSPGELQIGADGLVIDSQNFSIGTSNALSGTGSLTKIGTGALTLNGSNSYTGGTTILEGEVQVTGSLASGVTTGSVSDHSPILSGTGIITGNVSNFGVLAPGASPGTLTVQNGDVTMFANSTLNIEINPSIASEVLVHTGNFHIQSGSTFALFPDTTMGMYSSGKTYPVVAVDPGFFVTGTFSQITSSSPLLTGFLIYSTEEILLRIGLANLSGSVSSNNAKNVAKALDAIFTSGNPAFNSLFDSLMGLNSSQLTSALDQMNPSLYKGALIAQENNAVSIRNALTDRFQVVLDQRHCFTGKPGKSVPCKSKEKKWHIWAEGLGDFLHQTSLSFFGSPQVGYQDNTGGFASGADYHFYKRFYIGALGAYTHSNVKWQMHQGDADIDTGYAGIYFSALGRLFYGNLSFIGGWSNYDEQRNIVYPNVNQSAKNSHHGQQLISHLDVGCNIGVKEFTIRPFDALDWIVQSEDSFREHGAGVYNLQVNSTHAKMFRNELGVNFASCRCIQDLKLILDAKFSYVREMRTSGKSTESAFAEAPAVSFPTIGYFPSRNLFSFGVSANILAFKDFLTCGLYYNGVWGRKYSDQRISGSLNFGF